MSQWIEFEYKPIRRMRSAAIVITLAAFFVCGVFQPSWAVSSQWQPLIDQLVEDGYDEKYISYLFANPELEFSPEVMARKMNVLLNTKLSTKEPGPRPEPEVLTRYLNPLLIAGAYAFYREYRAEFVTIEQEYGVPGEVLTAILLVETRLGRNTGDNNAFNILASMALGGDFSLIKDHIKRDDFSEDIQEWLVKRTAQKGDWGYTELKALISYARANGQDPLSIPSSIYGAIGQCQFMPTSAEHYGRDGTGDGKVDLFDTRDALHSMANFVASHGWKKAQSYDDQLKVIYRYNHSESYAMTILSVADKIKKTKELFGG